MRQDVRKGTPLELLDQLEPGAQRLRQRVRENNAQSRTPLALPSAKK